MDCFYINLDNAKERCANLQRNFSEMKGPGWALSRFPAIDIAYVAAHNIRGLMSDSAKACYLSHRLLIASRRGSTQPSLILEDDAYLGAHSCSAIDDIITRVAPTEWDLVFTDVCIPAIQTMFDFIELRRQLAAKRTFVLQNLRDVWFGGTTAYIINPKSVEHLCKLLNEEQTLDEPLDLRYRRYCREGRLRAFVTFPFLTSLSPLSDTSQIQDGGAKVTELTWNLFRRLSWIDRDIDLCKEELAQLSSRVCDEETRLYGTLFASMLAASVEGRK